MKIKDVFGYGNIILTGMNDGVITLNPNDILFVEEVDNGSVVHLGKAGYCTCIEVKQTPGRIKQKANNLAARQERIHQQMEEEARIKAKEGFFDKYPKTKAMFQAECAELGQKCDLK